MPNHNSEHHVPFKLFFFVLLILCISFVMILVDETSFKVVNEAQQVPSQVTIVTNDTAQVKTPMKLSSQVYDGNIYYAFKNLTPSTNLIVPNEAFYIGTDSENILIVSNYPGWTSADGLFAFVGDELLVVNSQNNTIDVFKMLDNRAYFDRSIAMPAYDMGLLYGITCTGADSICNINTAFHFEAGCSLKLDLEDETFTDPLCGEGYNEFFTTYIPELK